MIELSTLANMVIRIVHRDFTGMDFMKAAVSFVVTASEKYSAKFVATQIVKIVKSIMTSVSLTIISTLSYYG